MLSEELILDIQQIIPTPEAADFMIGMSTKENEEKAAQDTQKHRHKLRQAFWEETLAQLRADGVLLYQNISPGRDHWLSAGSGVSSCPYQLIFSRDEARVELEMRRADSSENKRLFDLLYAEKESIEAAFGHPLEWRRMDEKKASKVLFSQSFDGYDRASWPQMIAWLSTHIRKFEAAFKGPLARLNRQMRTSGGDDR
jgi:hypothetical protein